MNKRILLVSNLIIVIFIVMGFLGVLIKDTKAYQDLSEKQMESIVELASSDIYKQIENNMSEPVLVSQTMSKDSFLKDWLEGEPENVDDEEYMEEIFHYLKEYQKEYDYTTVFCVSAITGNYYYQDGLNKVLSEEDEHDVWYYNFVKSRNTYDLEIDTNEADENQLSVFVNFRVEQEDGTLLGVIGVGLLESSIEEMINKYEEDYDLDVYIVNNGSAENSFTGNTNLFIQKDLLQEVTGIRDEIILEKSEDYELQWFNTSLERKCLITKYNEVLNWYLILEKETDTIMHSFRERLLMNIAYLIMSLVACLVATTIVFLTYNRIVIRMENTDELTGLPNRKLFREQNLKNIKNKEGEFSLFIFDIDDFKSINDTKGHMFGNAVLSIVGESIQSIVKDKGTVARWGGDEFFGILNMNAEESKKVLMEFMKKIEEEGNLMNQPIRVSVGIVEAKHGDEVDLLFEKADKALYHSKENGRNQITLI